MLTFPKSNPPFSQTHLNVCHQRCGFQTEPSGYQHKWITEPRGFALRGEPSLKKKIEQSARTIFTALLSFPSLLLTMLVKMPLLTVWKKLTTVMTFPTQPQSSIFSAWSHKTIPTTLLPQKVSLPPFHNELYYIRGLVLWLNWQSGSRLNDCFFEIV